mmetsp:Transcript_7873/g.20826  ORF Transcript_7873/g.20826 Transcript_7873/m.20826 type:complete len:215 (-) Transcript_7873:612-1256(-)
MHCRLSPRPSRTPTVRFRESGPKHVRNASPTPERPDSVTGCPPRSTATRRISEQPRVTSAATALVPRPRPSHSPAAMAITFFTAPATSSPTTSFDINTRKHGEDSIIARRCANRASFDATTTAVGSCSIISRANDGPDKYASGRFLPRTSGSNSHISLSSLTSSPLDVQSTGVSTRMCLATSVRNARVACTGTACTSKSAVGSTSAAFVDALTV